MKRLVGLMVCFTLLLSSMNGNVIMAQTEMGEGHYVTMGSYGGQALTWQIIHMDDDGTAVLWQNEIIAHMAFDAAESGVSGMMSGNDLRQAYGSNKFMGSNIYEWLNSDDYYVSYTSEPPTIHSISAFGDIDDRVLSGNLAFEKGFLSAFTQNEKNAINTSVFATKQAYVDSKLAKSMAFSFDIGTAEDAYSGWHVGRSEVGTGDVFLLSLKEMNEWVINGNKSTVKTSSDGQADYYWLRTPEGQSAIEVATIDYSGNAFKTTANYGYTGVVPAIRVLVNDFTILSGSGRAYAPFVLDFSNAFDVDKELKASDKAEIQAKVMGYKSQLLTDDRLATKEAIAREIEGIITDSSTPELMKKGYEYYLAKNSVVLHRQLFAYDHLLSKGSETATINFTDMKGVSSGVLEAVNLLVAYGIADGYEDGSFRPDQPVTRAETAKLMTLLAQTTSTIAQTSFDDVGVDDWHYSYVMQAKAKGYIKGYDGNVFKPNQTVTFDELSTMVARVLKEDFGYYDVLNEEELAYNAPMFTSAPWAMKHTALLVDSEILNSRDVYLGSRAVNRIEAAEILAPVLALIYE